MDSGYRVSEYVCTYIQNVDERLPHYQALNYKEYSRRSNVFPITLRPHGSNFRDVVNAIGAGGLRALDRGINLKINGEEEFVCAYTLAFIGDMPQQQENSGMKSQRATRVCRHSSARDTSSQRELGQLGPNPVYASGKDYFRLMQARNLIPLPSLDILDQFFEDAGEDLLCEVYTLRATKSTFQKPSPCRGLEACQRSRIRSSIWLRMGLQS